MLSNLDTYLEALRTSPCPHDVFVWAAGEAGAMRSVRGALRDAGLSETFAEQRTLNGNPTRELTRTIILGVVEHGHDIDTRIMHATTDAWPIERMPAVDRALLRIGVWEILRNDEVPTAVAIDEAVELAKEFSTDDSGAFVHGVLGRIGRAG